MAAAFNAVCHRGIIKPALLAALCGSGIAKDPYFFAFLLLDLVFYAEALENVVKAVTTPAIPSSHRRGSGCSFAPCRSTSFPPFHGLC